MLQAPHLKVNQGFCYKINLSKVGYVSHNHIILSYGGIDTYIFTKFLTGYNLQVARI